MTGKRNGSEIRKVTSEELIEELHKNVDLLAASKIDRADLKLLSTAMRELRYCFKVFSELRSQKKVTAFGSARISANSPQYRQAVAFGREMGRRQWYVISGAGSGIMEAVHVGAGPEFSLGINILLPFEQADNAVMAKNPRLMHVKYFFTRKLLFVKEADAVALFPGGYGTMDEAYEVLTLLQTGKGRLFPIVLIDEPGGDYWTSWERFVKDNLLKRGMISAPDLSFFRITSDAAEAAEEITGFYHVYHSMRYVGPDLVIRLTKPLSPEALENLSVNFSDIITEGAFRLDKHLPEEGNEPDLNKLPRLIFRFNRKDFGRLRQLIDFLNKSS